MEGKSISFCSPLTLATLWSVEIIAAIICHNDELSLSLSWLDYLLTDSEVLTYLQKLTKSFSKFILFPFS